jgi:hypothetical protein
MRVGGSLGIPESMTDATRPVMSESKRIRRFSKVCTRGPILNYSAKLIIFLGVAVVTGTVAQNAPPALRVDASSGSPGAREVMNRVIAGVKEAEREANLYERIERVETRKQAGDSGPVSVKAYRVVPAGTGTAKIPLGPDGKPTDQEAYRTELEKLLKSLTWAAETGQPQREAYLKVQKKLKERDEAIDATRNAFVFTFLDDELRGNRRLSKYKMEPNPAFKPTNRMTSIYMKVKGLIWVDDASHQLARAEVEVTDDISLGLFMAKIYKSSRFYQDRYEVAPGVWLPTVLQFDFDGRKFFSSFSVHEKTYYSGYKRIGPPAEAIPQIQAELAGLETLKPKQSLDR